MLLSKHKEIDLYNEKNSKGEKLVFFTGAAEGEQHGKKGTFFKYCKKPRHTIDCYYKQNVTDERRNNSSNQPPSAPSASPAATTTMSPPSVASTSQTPTCISSKDKGNGSIMSCMARRRRGIQYYDNIEYPPIVPINPITPSLNNDPTISSWMNRPTDIPPDFELPPSTPESPPSLPARKYIDLSPYTGDFDRITTPKIAGIARRNRENYNTLYLDSCCGQHMVGSPKFISESKHMRRPCEITIANNNRLKAYEIGAVDDDGFFVLNFTGEGTTGSFERTLLLKTTPTEAPTWSHPDEMDLERPTLDGLLRLRAVPTTSTSIQGDIGPATMEEEENNGGSATAEANTGGWGTTPAAGTGWGTATPTIGPAHHIVPCPQRCPTSRAALLCPSRHPSGRPLPCPACRAALPAARRPALPVALPCWPRAALPWEMPDGVMSDVLYSAHAPPCPSHRPCLRAALLTWLDDLQLYLQSESRDGDSLFDHTSGTSLAPPETADSATRSQWLTRDNTARLTVCNNLPLAKRARFGQHKTAKAMFDAVVTRYSSPATAALSRLILPYLFPELSPFATVVDLITYLRTSDTR
ncbi:unnamed protein product [Closterium sp. NIES-53]